MERGIIGCSRNVEESTVKSAEAKREWQKKSRESAGKSTKAGKVEESAENVKDSSGKAEESAGADGEIRRLSGDSVGTAPLSYKYDCSHN